LNDWPPELIESEKRFRAAIEQAERNLKQAEDQLSPEQREQLRLRGERSLQWRLAHADYLYYLALRRAAGDLSKLSRLHQARVHLELNRIGFKNYSKQLSRRDSDDTPENRGDHA
jgi:hypothetical protein